MKYPCMWITQKTKTEIVNLSTSAPGKDKELIGLANFDLQEQWTNIQVKSTKLLMYPMTAKELGIKADCAFDNMSDICLMGSGLVRKAPAILKQVKEQKGYLVGVSGARAEIAGTTELTMQFKDEQGAPNFEFKCKFFYCPGFNQRRFTLLLRCNAQNEIGN